MEEVNWKRSSRLEWQTRGDQPSREQLQVGCLQRIADATEKMAVRHTELIRERDQYHRWYDEEVRAKFTAQRQASALRGQITKLKRQLEAARSALKSAQGEENHG